MARLYGRGDVRGDSVHGTGCAEIIYDIAPDTELVLLKTGDLTDLENAKDYCIREGIDIVSYSTSWPTTGFGDGRGLVCDIVDDASDNGILWVNIAGNYAESHYAGFWSDHDSDGWLNFHGDGEVLPLVEVEKGEEIVVGLTWNDWPTSRDNYDLYLYFVNPSGDLESVAESTDRQDEGGGRPAEWLEYGAEQSGGYRIAVRNEGAQARGLKIYSGHEFDEYAVARNSIGIPADARGVLAVGAIHPWHWEDGQIADYSSRGPTTDGRSSPTSPHLRGCQPSRMVCQPHPMALKATSVLLPRHPTSPAPRP